ncbi:hypothetical protein [Streptomyces sp. NPDC047000]|uniref:hypothetical protein n=1 Tax=Streptomyces sp. NPDC047000 TaxID=3155474 RepID=UPI0033C30461
MSLPPPSRTSPGPRRRTLFASAAGGVLAVVGAVGVSGCSGQPADGDSGSGGSPSAADRTRARAARDSLALLARYDAAIAAHRTLAARLRPLRAAVARHVTAFGGDQAKAAGTAKAPSSGSPSGSASTPVSGPASASASVSPSGSAGDTPETAKDALAGLAAAERELAARRTAALPDVPGELARLLASVAAAGAAHVFLLTETEGGR